jgi:tetrapyrrole methylase family protein/MazG family protein
MSITIVGLGPGPLDYLTREAESILLAEPRILFRWSRHPAYDWLKEFGKSLMPFDFTYSTRMTPTQRYEFMCDIVVHEAKHKGTACYAVPGNPGVLETTTAILRRRSESGEFDLRVVPGMSFLDMMYAEFGIHPFETQLLFTGDVKSGAFDVHSGVIIPNIDMNPAKMKPWLLARYPEHHPVMLIGTSGMPKFETRSTTVPLADLDASDSPTFAFGSIYVPPVPRP